MAPKRRDSTDRDHRVLIGFKPGASRSSAADACELSLSLASGSSTTTALSPEPLSATEEGTGVAPGRGACAPD